VFGELFIAFGQLSKEAKDFIGRQGLHFSVFEFLAEFRDGGVVGSEGIFFRMEFVVPEPIVDCLGDFHETPPGRGFLGICFPGG